ncbi:MAG: iron-sulfur cluster assembly scaffold protein [Dehalococcoidia bacterium]|nr:iron-sulfur cluster assembly scaffold protein [Dehalococcoidia bacterium]
MTNGHIVKTPDAAEQVEAAYSKTAVDHMRNPRNVGLISNADGQASITGPCGDTMEIWLRVNDGIIERALFWTDGCGPSIAAGSMVTELARGKKVGEAFRITQQDVLEALGELPEESVHCALLAANTMKEAVKDYLAFRNEPWKRAYRK